MVDEVRVDRRYNRSMVAPSELGTGIQVVQSIRTVLGIDMHAMSAILRFRSPSRDPGIRNLWNIFQEESSDDREANSRLKLCVTLVSEKKKKNRNLKKKRKMKIISKEFSNSFSNDFFIHIFNNWMR